MYYGILKKLLAWIILVFLANSNMNCQGDWKLSFPTEQGLDSIILMKLDSRIENELPHFRSLLIARNGYLIFEKYYHGASANEFQNLHSVTKSITSALIGIALNEGYITSLDDKVIDYYPDCKDSINDSRVNDIKIRHLLTMSSGIDEIPTMFAKGESNPNQTTLKKDLIFDPGSNFKYSSPSSHLLAGILNKTTGKSVLDYARDKLLKPMGIKTVIWYKDHDGLEYGCGSSLWKARDILKFGQLYLNHGMWDQNQLIPPEYVNESTKKHISGTFYVKQVNYGYLWWISEIDGFKVFSAEGYGSQILRVIPGLNMVILCTSDWNQPYYAEHETIIENYIIPSILSERFISTDIE